MSCPILQLISPTAAILRNTLPILLTNFRNPMIGPSKLLAKNLQKFIPSKISGCSFIKSLPGNMSILSVQPAKSIAPKSNTLSSPSKISTNALVLKGIFGINNTYSVEEFVKDPSNILQKELESKNVYVRKDIYGMETNVK